MRVSDLFSISIEAYVAVIATVIVCFVFLKMSFGYTQKRANKRYAENKVKAPSIPSFTHLSKVLFVLAMLLTVASYWWDFPAILQFHDSVTLRLAGALWVLGGYIGLTCAFATLGGNYSPLFDAYKPFELTKSGVYAKIRHPIYLFNLFVSFGLALSSGLIIVVITALVGLVFVTKALLMEERYLKQQFTAYEAYCASTWRLIPYVF